MLDYDLPRDLIAQSPLANRADARLMVVSRRDQTIHHFHVRDLPDLFRSGDRLVVNDTRVTPAQLTGEREATGGAWRGLFLSAEPDGHWQIVCKTRGKLQPHEKIVLHDREGRPAGRLWLLERLGEGRWLAHPEGDEPTPAVLARVGRVPLPHYIREGQMVDADVEDYQTVYARQPGAVAAPTAGLHFTKPLLKTIEGRGVTFSSVTLHVGLGTFRPISADSVEDHVMHPEWCEASAETVAAIDATRAAGGRVVAVGTTSVRTLETAARQAESSPGKTAPWCGETDLFIRPPGEFRLVDALMTNFHFPRTTLLLMVQAFGGEELIRQAYEEAIAERYRFYSYGDAMLIL
ncbi:S-adenosylmethionine:tRNA ribosyltransferase-isomerase [Pseudobythopirellula maris]|uniref:S-adenosylmethionine:tRNA ribosyltransferase-isomerase n=1 Tax=Pseudobythopirellula maris TaxID=2527991 RepID=A0A5C5ZMS6_9BACT|nr:tRNA preQ1(34) S-adenosylmethionine ribosyltransferase-isomerase QueA [Pseudobythopirellula maris]TWT88375.1 S-adenosylmethionine:tRNA ribosyltransferase-isomerase [Pseudobythopirellula maris]